MNGCQRLQIGAIRPLHPQGIRIGLGTQIYIISCEFTGKKEDIDHLKYIERKQDNPHETQISRLLLCIIETVLQTDTKDQRRAYENRKHNDSREVQIIF